MRFTLIDSSPSLTRNREVSCKTKKRWPDRYKRIECKEWLGLVMFLFFYTLLATVSPSSIRSPYSWVKNNIDTNTKGSRRYYPGTRTTGVGSRSKRNRSVFTIVDDRQRPQETPSSTFMFAKVENGRILLRFLSSYSKSKDIVLTLSNACGDKNNETSLEIHQLNAEEFINQGWVPMEGIYGLLHLSSGWHLVLITESELIYQSTPEIQGSAPPLLNIRRIQSLEIVPLSTQHSLSPVAKKAGERQIRLLRKAFREHDLYFVPIQPNTTLKEEMIITDFTNTIQRCFMHREAHHEDGTCMIHPVGIQFYFLEVFGAFSFQVGHNYSLSFSFDHDDNINVTAVTTKAWSGFSINILEPISDLSGHAICMDEIIQSLLSPWQPWMETTNQGMSQRQKSTSYELTDSRFFWNEKNIELVASSIRNLSLETQEIGNLLLEFCIPVTSAFVGIKQGIKLVSNSSLPDLVYDEVLISRRSKYRAGTRFTRRGADGTGAVANFAETEQICVIKDLGATTSSNSPAGIEGYEVEIYSHVQTRGSIPLRWSSPADVKTYRPRVLIGTDPLSQARSLRNHLFDQLYTYCISVSNFSSTTTVKTSNAKLVFVNLIDKKSDQGRLGRAFDSVLNAVIDIYSKYFQTNDDDGASERQSNVVSKLVNTDSIKHVWFDFHENVKHGKWDKLETVLNEVSALIDEQGYFCATQKIGMKWNIKALQDGVIRTNCMDCLDRTNVVQSIFGRYILFRQLQDRKGIIHSSRRATRYLPLGLTVAFQRHKLKLPWTDGEEAHRLLWADNADAISRLYAGTNALKGDFTRTGVRTNLGVFDDGINSLQRYYLNNFQDAQRQEAIDLLVGNVDFAFIGYDDEKPRLDSDETHYKRIKTDRGHHTSKINLRLQWLPGDLQSQMRSCSVNHFTQQLNDIDRRASSDQPWWAIETII